MKVYFSCPKSRHSTFLERYLCGAIGVVFGDDDHPVHVECSNYHERRDEPLVKHFDAMCDMDCGIFLPDSAKLTFDQMQQWEMKVMIALKKPIYYITPEKNIIKTEVILNEIPKQSSVPLLQNKVA